MKNLILSILIGLAVGISAAVVELPLPPKLAALNSFKSDLPIPSYLINAHYLPKKLIIPKLNMTTVVEEVRLNKEGKMGAPDNWNHAGWYALGTVPGGRGNAVIDGHYDSPTGPAIFTYLDSLQAGDDVYVVTALGRKLKFKVVDKKVYADEDFPVIEIFGPSSEKRLNLITCEGVFDRRAESYSHRIVVFTKLVE